MGTQRDITFESGAKGRCTSKKYSGGIRLTVTEEGPNEGTIYEIKKDNISVPATISAPNMFFKLSSDDNFLYNLHPYGEWKDMDDNYDTIFTVHITGMPRKKDAPDPMFWTRQGRLAPWGKWQPEALMFTIFTQILEPKKYKGLQIPGTFLYGFDRDELGNMKVVGIGTDATKLEALMNLGGFDWIEDEIPYSNNVLPDLEALFLDRDRPFVVRMRKGYINKLLRVREGYGQ